MAKSNSGGSETARIRNPISLVWMNSSSFPQNRFQPMTNMARGKRRLANPKKPTKIHATVAP